MLLFGALPAPRSHATEAAIGSGPASDACMGAFDGSPAARFRAMGTLNARSEIVLDILADAGGPLRLAWIDIPEGIQPQAAAYLQTAAGTQIAVLPLAGADRWGRTPAAVAALAGDGGIGPTLQQNLLAAGLARLRADGSPAPSPACLRQLAAAEAAARDTGAGLWADARYRLRQADDVTGLAALAGHFVVIEGRPRSINERQAWNYINFGSRWAHDTTVTAPKRIWRALADRGMSAQRLRDGVVRARGIVDMRGGPSIELASPEDLELVSTERTP